MEDARPLPNMPRPGEIVDRYRVVAQIARGGMAVVYAVQRTSIGGFEKLLAMKMMLPHLVGERRFVDMFLDEARIASRIHHANVVHVFDVGEHHDVPFLIMELLRGQSLAAVLGRSRERGVTLPIEFCLDVIAQAADGLEAAHDTCDGDGQRLGIVHRDVSPQNIFVGYDGQVKVVDFGIAAARGRLVSTRTGELKGKFAYLAPEQIPANRPITRAADLWALGVVAWEVLAGRRLFAADDDATVLWNVMNSAVPDLARVAPGVPVDAAQAIMKCLVRDPERRTLRGHELATALRLAANDLARAGPSASAGGIRVTHSRAVMGDLFADGEREAERQLTAAASQQHSAAQGGASKADSHVTPRLRPEPAAAVEDTQLSSASGPRERPGRRSWLAVASIGLAAVVAVAIAGAFARRANVETDAASNAPTTRSAAPEQVAQSDLHDEPPPVATSIARVHVDSRAKLVLVDGTRHDERPLEIALREGETAVVEIIGADGIITKHVVALADDGRRIATEVAPPTRPRQTHKGKVPRSTPSTPPRPLMPWPGAGE